MRHAGHRVAVGAESVAVELSRARRAGRRPFVRPIEDAGVEKIFALGNNTFVVKNDGSLWGWGGGGRSDWPFKTNVKVPTTFELK